MKGSRNGRSAARDAAEDLRIGARVLGSLPRFLRAPLGPEACRAIVAARLANREAGFLRQLAAYGDEETSLAAPVDLNRVLRDIEPVLKRVAGDDVEIELPKASSPLNVDVKGVTVLANGLIRAQIVVEYQPYVENVPRLPSMITASSLTEFVSGVKTLILQAADPMSDRRTTIEVTATLLK